MSTSKSQSQSQTQTQSQAQAQALKPIAILRRPGDRGPRHARYPEINVSATAEVVGISKSQLSRLLNGDNHPGIKSIQRLSAILGKPAGEIIAMYAVKNTRRKTRSKK